MPFESEAQRRWMYANHPDMAKEWESHTPKGEKLPKRKKRRQKRKPRSKSVVMALWASKVTYDCLMECGDNIEAGLAAAEIILSTEQIPEDFLISLAVDIHGHKHLGKGKTDQVTSTGAPAKGGEFAKQSTPDTEAANTPKQAQQQQPVQTPLGIVDMFEHPESPAWTLTVEHAAIRLANGKDFYIQGDDPKQVRIPHRYIASLKDAVYSHNHPNGTPALSVADVNVAIIADLAEMRAITEATDSKTGKKIRYVVSLKRPKGGWKDDLLKEYSQAKDKILKEVQYSPTMREEISEKHHQALAALAKKHGAQYERKVL